VGVGGCQAGENAGVGESLLNAGRCRGHGDLRGAAAAAAAAASAASGYQQHNNHLTNTPHKIGNKIAACITPSLQFTVNVSFPFSVETVYVLFAIQQRADKGVLSSIVLFF
jgi:hypothetical protein